MIWIYRLVFMPLFLLLVPQQLLKMWRRGGYRHAFLNRFGYYRSIPAKPAQTKRIWIQAVSVGEVIAIGPLLERFNQHPQLQIVLTVTTSTGYQTACARYATAASYIGYFPFDFWPWVQRAWRKINPDAIILTESELWPEHLQQAKCSQTPAFLINARLSDRSYQRYQTFRKSARELLQIFDSCYAASEQDRARLLKLGMAPEKVHCYGNIKLDQARKPTIPDQVRQEILAELGFVSSPEHSPFILLGASTWAGEESALIKAQAQLLQSGVDCRLLLVPRHAERAQAIVELMQKQALRWHQRSQKKQAPAATQIYLADTTGELSKLSQVANLAFIGKSLPPHTAGQTPIEAASHGIPILMGIGMNNFKQIAHALEGCGAARSVANSEALIQAIQHLHQQPQIRNAMGTAGKAWYSRNQGSSQRIADSLNEAFHRR